MTRKLQILRGTTAQNNAYTGAVGELTMDTDRNEVRIHDGQTVGGIKIGDRNMPILTSMFFDHVVNDMSWLRADTFSWQSGDVYVAAYNHLVGDLNTNVIENGVTYYAWEPDASIGLPVLYTSSETPSVGDMALYYNGEFREYEPITAVGDGYIEVLYDGIAPVRLGRFYGDTQTDTIGDITITYYQAEDGHKICLPDQESNISALYEKTGAADYYILDTTNKQFKLPRKQKRTLIQAVKNDDGTWYNLYSDGWVEQGCHEVPGGTSWTLPVPMANDAYTLVASYIDSSSTNTSQWRHMGIEQYSTYVTPKENGVGQRIYICGMAAESAYASAGMRLEYYYVGNFTQEAIEQTAGITAETLNGKADTDLGNIPTNYDYVVESQLPTAENGYTWYRKYKSGWVEQGGYVANSGNENLTITLPVPMANSIYDWKVGISYNSTENATYYQFSIWNQTATSIVIRRAGNIAKTWQVSGMAAQ